jgi:hypothetical protein
LLNFEVMILVEFAICREGFELVSGQDQGARFLYTGFVAGDLLHSLCKWAYFDGFSASDEFLVGDLAFG